MLMKLSPELVFLEMIEREGLNWQKCVKKEVFLHKMDQIHKTEMWALKKFT